MGEEDGGLSKYFTYPKDGSRKEIPTGDTKIDFNNGEVALPDGTREELLTSLKQEEKEWIRSIFLEADQDITVWLDGGSLTPVDSGEYFTIPHVNFKVLWIKATTATNIAVWASTHPDGAIRKTKK